MNTIVCEKGVLLPFSPLNLPERTQLEIRIVQTGEDAGTDAERAYQVLLQAGLIQPLFPTAIEMVSESEQQRAADMYGQAGTLSDFVIAERDGV
ncbi:MAG: hypothetical protein Fur0021_05790 [Candidatus Promineifilaceae bacterium]